MNHRLETLLNEVRQLEREMVGQVREKEKQFCYSIYDQKVAFTAAATERHAKLRLGIPGYVLPSRFFVLATSPIIWLCALPIAFADLIGTFYQAVCFPIFGIPKVRRGECLAFDRHHLSYLNFLKKRIVNIAPT